MRLQTTPILPPSEPEVLPPTPVTPTTTELGLERTPLDLQTGTNVSLEPDSALLSPIAPTIFPVNQYSGPNSPNSSVQSRRGGGENGATGGSTGNPSPFNFQPVIASKNPVVPKPNQRRGHKYKHSSVSHQIFLEPPVRAPLSLPASLPIPTFAELRRSATSTQRGRLLWCAAHFLSAFYVSSSSFGSLALIALSHLLVFDAMGATLCVIVDVLSNFEVWQRSSIRHPFGLERAEVLAGFAMSVFLLFMGFDVISHGVEHAVEDIYGPGVAIEGADKHAAHVARVAAGAVDTPALAALISTVVSAVLLKNHARIAHAMRVSALNRLPAPLANPSHLLTLAASAVLLLLPLLSIGVSPAADRILAFALAISMIAMGVRLVKSLGSMLLLSLGDEGVEGVVAEVARSPGVLEVQEARFWQAHHGLGIATLKLMVREGGESEKGVRERIVRLVRDRLGGTYGSGRRGQARWEVSVAVTMV